MNKFILSIFVFQTSIFNAQSISTSQPIPERYIEMNGRAEIEVIPDEIFIQISIQEKLKKSDNSEIELKEKAMIQALTKINVDMRNLSLKDEYSGYASYWKKSNSILKKKDFILKLKDAKMIGLIYQEMDKIEIENVDIVEIKHSKQDSFRKEMRIQAIKAARDKVDYLLTAISESKDKLMEVREEINSEYANSNIRQGTNNGFYSNTTYSSANGAFESMEMNFKKIKISATIYLKYSLK